jgi:hypothetical protein
MAAFALRRDDSPHIFGHVAVLIASSPPHNAQRDHVFYYFAVYSYCKRLLLPSATLSRRGSLPPASSRSPSSPEGRKKRPGGPPSVIFLGEVETKFVPLSPQRFRSVAIIDAEDDVTRRRPNIIVEAWLGAGETVSYKYLVRKDGRPLANFGDSEKDVFEPRYHTERNTNSEKVALVRSVIEV